MLTEFHKNPNTSATPELLTAKSDNFQPITSVDRGTQLSWTILVKNNNRSGYDNQDTDTKFPLISICDEPAH